MTTKPIPTMLSYQDGRPTQIVAANFTWALEGGCWLRDVNGTVDWLSWDTIRRNYGEAMVEKIVKATSGWLTGVWKNL